MAPTQFAQPVLDAPATVTVITREEIDAMNVREIPELLRLVPGFIIAYENGSNVFAAYQGMNDGFSRRMQVLVDGRSVYNELYGGVVWSSLPLEVDDIERIEVVRGPNASTDGANSFLGTISITTRDPALDRGVYTRVRGGNNAIRDGYARYGGGGETLNYRLTTSYRQDAGLETRPDDRQIRYLSGRADWTPTSTQRLMAQGGYTNSDLQQGFDTDQFSVFKNPFEACFPSHNRPINEGYGQLAYEYTPSQVNQTRAQLYYQRLHTDFHYTFPWLCGGATQANHYTLDRYDGEIRHILRLGDTVRLIGGAELRRDNITGAERNNRDPNSPYSNDHGNLSSRLLGHLEWKFAPTWLLNTGAMLEKDTLSGYFGLSPRVALTYFLTDQQALRLGFSRGVRTPTFTEEDWKSNFYLSSGGLAAEKISSWELAYVGHLPNYAVNLDARLFRNRIWNLIVTNPVVTPFDYVNQGHVNLYGFEAEATWQPTRAFQLNLAYAFTEASSDDPFGLNFAHTAPRHIFNTLATYRFNEHWQSSLDYYYASKMEWLNDGTPVPAIHYLSWRLAHWFTPGVNLSLKLENILHDEVIYKETNKMGRIVFGQLETNF